MKPIIGLIGHKFLQTPLFTISHASQCKAYTHENNATKYTSSKEVINYRKSVIMSDSSKSTFKRQSIVDAITPSGADQAEFGPATTHGAGTGNKTSDFRKDSLRGSTVEGIGKMLHSDGLIAKGQNLRKKEGWEG
ncbi:hypothetical protein PGQ11_000777 [Apiospora arundinis]